MTKLLHSVGVALAVATMSLLAGCQLYFGNSGPGGDDDGSSSGGNRPPGFECDSNAQCAAGCFCADGICTEAGFCAGDRDCGSGFHCDTARSSCVPNPACATSDDCKLGSACDPVSGSCVATCACINDTDAIAKGFGWCDENRGTCMKGTDPAGACLGSVTCTTAEPVCPEGQVALVKDGCFTGKCREIGVCEAAPICESLQHETDCGSRAADCHKTFIGRNCTGPGCGTGGQCTCTEFDFDSCDTGAAPPVVVPTP